MADTQKTRTLTLRWRVAEPCHSISREASKNQACDQRRRCHASAQEPKKVGGLRNSLSELPSFMKATRLLGGA